MQGRTEQDPVLAVVTVGGGGPAKVCGVPGGAGSAWLQRKRSLAQSTCRLLEPWDCTSGSSRLWLGGALFQDSAVREWGTRACPGQSGLCGCHSRGLEAGWPCTAVLS